MVNEERGLKEEARLDIVLEAMEPGETGLVRLAIYRMVDGLCLGRITKNGEHEFQKGTSAPFYGDDRMEETTGMSGRLADSLEATLERIVQILDPERPR